MCIITICVAPRRQLVDYITSYSSAFKLNENITLKREVTYLTYDEGDTGTQPRFRVTSVQTDTGREYKYFVS